MKELQERIEKSGRYKILRLLGEGGSWDTHYAQAHHLASHGFAVLCLEHVGSNSERMKSSPRLMRNLKEMIYDSTEVLGRPAGHSR
ncbi:hypothetical protein EBZ37_08975 [bacterium]|nr:hypothetical protein [bacterium]